MTALSKICVSLVLALATAATANAAPKRPAQPPTAQHVQRLPEPVLPKLEIVFLRAAVDSTVTRPFFLPLPADEGLPGARLGIVDNNTTGRFTKQSFSLKEMMLPTDGDPGIALKALIAEGHRHILVDLPAATIEALAKLPEAAETLLYNIGTSDDRLRGEACAPNLLHLLPSRAMRADALAQYLAKKRWPKLFLVRGPTEADDLYAAATRRSAQRFGLKIVAEKPWEHSFDDRRTPESEIPVFTQGVDYDVLVVADEAGSFGDYLSFRTWQPRPVAGTQGLSPLAWHYTHEMWGALQLQKRFKESSGRWMGEKDYAAWLAVRAIGEAASRTGSLEFAKLKTFLTSEAFALAGFKGVPLSFRAWDGQMRQPVLLAGERSLVAVAPIEGFLHPKNELDTLGYDRPESACHFK